MLECNVIYIYIYIYRPIYTHTHTHIQKKLIDKRTQLNYYNYAKINIHLKY